ncbi:MAG TPA: tetratricopeptide repeat protein [Abditibacterium sp.]
MKISRFSLGGETPRRLAISLLGVAVLGASWPAGAQNRPPAAPGTSPGTSPGTTAGTAPLAVPGVTAPVTSALPATPNINILLIALDSLAVSEAPPAAPSAAPLPLLPPPALAPVPGAVAPGAVAPAPLPGAITPASATIPGAVRWLTAAQKPPKPNKNDALFKLEPETGMQPLKTTPAPKPVAPTSGLAANPTGFPEAPLPPGRSQLGAVSLRRALLALGWNDVLNAAPDSTAINRAVGERRLTPRTLDNLKRAMAQVAQSGTTPSDAATQSALQAAARIGQTLGYRAVVAYYIAPPTLQDGTSGAVFSLVLADSAREVGEPISFLEKAFDENFLREAGASTAATRLDKALRAWPTVSALDRAKLGARHLDAARAALAAGQNGEAQEQLNQAIALDSSRAEPYVLLGDLLATSDPIGAASAYRRAVELNGRDGLTWTKIAVALGGGTIPDWPRSLEAGRQALASNFDSVELRVAMATAQFGRADLFRRAERLQRAEEAEEEARRHLERALELAPDNPDAVRLLAGRLVDAGRFREATQTLDRIAPRYPNDLEIQSQYAIALTAQPGREEDAFVANARVWKLSGRPAVEIDDITYRTLMQGFDLWVYKLGKSAVQLTGGVAAGALPREEALLQLTKLKEDMELADHAINVLRPPATTTPDGPGSRIFAANLMIQALEAQQIYLETGQELQRVRGSQLNSQAIARLNAARIGR